MATMLFRMNQPVELVREMVYALSVELFQSSITTFLDPAMGKGDFLVMIAQRLKEHGHTKENILSRLYGFETNQLYINACLAKTPIAGANITVKTYEEVLEWTPDMKFDCVIMNPPFNNESSTASPTSGNRRNKGTLLHIEFITKALQLATQVAVVCPVKGWFIGRERTEKKDLISRGQIRYVNLVSGVVANKLFNAKTGPIGIFLLTSNAGPTTDVYMNGRLLRTQPSTHNIMFGEHVDLLERILGTHQTVGCRLNNGSGPTRSGGIKYATPAGDVPFVEIIGAKNAPLVVLMCSGELLDPTSPAYDKRQGRYRIDADIAFPRVGVNQNGEAHVLGAMKLIPPGSVTSYSVSTLTCSTTVEAENLISYLQSNVARFCINQTHQSQSIGQATFQYIPNIDLTRSWTNEELYNYFNLTQDEIKLIEDTIK